MTDPTDPKDPLDPEAAWRAAVLAALGPDERELEDESDEEVARDLRDRGMDPARLRAKGASLAATLMAEWEDEKAQDAGGAMLTDGGRKPIMDDAGVDAARKDIKK